MSMSVQKFITSISPFVLSTLGGDWNAGHGDQFEVRVVLAGNLSLGAAASSRVANDGDVRAGQTNETIDVPGVNTDGLQDKSSSGVEGANDAVTADIAGGGRGVVALAGSDGDARDRDKLIYKCGKLPKIYMHKRARLAMRIILAVHHSRG